MHQRQVQHCGKLIRRTISSGSGGSLPAANWGNREGGAVVPSIHDHPSTVHKSKWHGSEHWLNERFFSALLVPSLATAFIAGPVFANDILLGVLLPVHIHMGFDCIIQDYLPSRKYKTAHNVALWTLRVATGVVVYGLFTLNTVDVGITRFVAGLWTSGSGDKSGLDAE